MQSAFEHSDGTWRVTMHTCLRRAQGGHRNHAHNAIMKDTSNICNLGQPGFAG